MPFVVGRLVAALTADTSSFDAGIAKARGRAIREARKIEGQWVRSGQRLSTFGRELSFAVSAPLAIAGGASLKAALDFEAAFARVRKTVGGTAEELAALQAKIRELAAGPDAIALNVGELNKIAELGGQLGIQRKNIAGFTRDIGELAIVAKSIPAEEAATGIAQLTNIMGTSQSETRRYASTIVGLGDSMVTTERQILDFGLRLAGAGKVAGFTEAGVLSLGASLASVGLEAEAGGTAFSRVIIEIEKAVSTGSKNLDEFARVAGANAKDFAEAWKRSPTDALTSFVQGLGRVQKEGGDLFGVLEVLQFENVRVRDALLRSAAAGNLMADAFRNGERFYEENNALTQKSTELHKTNAAALQLAKQRITEAAITIGNDLAPAAVAVSGGIASMAAAFGSLPGPVRQSAVAALAATAALFPLIAMGGKLRIVFGHFVGLLPTVIRNFRLLSIVPSLLTAPFAAAAGAAGVLTGSLVAVSGALGVLVGTKLRQWINNSLGGFNEFNDSLGTTYVRIQRLFKLIGEGALAPKFELARALEADAGRFAAAVERVQHLRGRLRLSPDEFPVPTDRTLEGALKLVEVEEAMLRYVREVRQAVESNEDLRKSYQNLVPADLRARIDQANGAMQRMRGLFLPAEEMRDAAQDLIGALELTGSEWEVFTDAANASSEDMRKQLTPLELTAQGHIRLGESILRAAAAQKKAATGTVLPGPNEDQQKAIERTLEHLKEQRREAELTRAAMARLAAEEAAPATTGPDRPGLEEARGLQAQTEAIEDLNAAQRARLAGTRELVDRGILQQELADNKASAATRKAAAAEHERTASIKASNEEAQRKIERQQQHEDAIRQELKSLKEGALEAGRTAEAYEEAARAAAAGVDPQLALDRALRSQHDAWVLVRLAAQDANAEELVAIATLQAQAEAFQLSIEAQQDLARWRDLSKTEDQRAREELVRLHAAYAAGALKLHEYQAAAQAVTNVRDQSRTADQQAAEHLALLDDLYASGALKVHEYHAQVLATLGIQEAIKTESQRAAEEMARLNLAFQRGAIDIGEYVTAAREIETTSAKVARAAEGAFRNFLLDPLKDGFRGMVLNFLGALQEMVAAAAAARLADLLFQVIGGAAGAVGGGAGAGAGAAGNSTGFVHSGTVIPRAAAGGLLQRLSAGGTVEEQESSKKRRGLASGGLVDVRLSNGEYDIRGAAVRRVSPRYLQQLNAGLLSPEEAAQGRPLARRAGGLIRGPGTGTSDSIETQVPEDDFIVRAAAVEKYGTPLLEGVNRGTLPKLAAGGTVRPSSVAAAGLRGLRPRRANREPRNGLTVKGKARILGEGLIRGPGTGTSDSIAALTRDGKPLRFSDGEYIVRERAVEHYGVETFDRFNRLEMPEFNGVSDKTSRRLAGGGLVGGGAAAGGADGGGVKFSTVQNLVIDARGAQVGAAEEIRTMLVRERERWSNETVRRVAETIQRGGRNADALRGR